MLGDQIKKLAAAWADAYEHLGGPTEDEWPVVFEVIDLTGSEPETLWQFVLDVLALQPSNNVLGMLAAGPLEDLIQDHGAAFVDRVAAEAKSNQSFAALLPKVWVPASGDPITQRYIQLGCDQVGQPSNNSFKPKPLRGSA
ncbi:DUF6869 domain-containing protein [Lysobacter tyrosinilyticus]